MGHRFPAFVLAPLVLALGCAGPDVDPAPDTGLDLGKGDFVASQTLWQTPRVPVCWEPDAMAPEHADARAWVEDAARTSWSAVSAVELRGWGACEAGAVGVRVGLTDAAPHTLGLGKELDGVEGGMRLNFEFASWSPGCRETREFCVRAGAVHEIGHALGFAHEQNRADTPGWCAGERGAFGDLSFSDWDLDSIMNYCNPEWTGDGDLSPADINAVRALYGRRRGTVVIASSDGARLGAERELAAIDPALAERSELANVRLGDVTGDGRADLVLFDPDAGRWQVLTASGGSAEAGPASFGPAATWASWTGTRGAVGLLGDVDGDGTLDAIDVTESGDWTAGRSSGGAFGAPAWLGAIEARGAPLVADLDGDGRDDAVVVERERGVWWGARSVGTGLGAAERLRDGHGAGAAAHFARDVSGDGRADLVAAYAGDGAWWVADAAPGRPDARWTEGHGALASERFLMDLTGDGRASAVAYERDRGTWFARASSGESFGPDVVIASALSPSLPSVQPTILVGDVDGDGRDDVVLVY